MCTGAEIPAAMGALTAGTAAAGAGTGAAMSALPATAALSSGALAGMDTAGVGGLLSTMPELGAMGGMSTAAVPGLLSATPADLAATGTAALSGATPSSLGGDLASKALQVGGNMGPQQADILAAQNQGFGPAGLNSTLQAANPTYDTMSRGLAQGMDAMGNYNKAQSAMGLMQGGPRPAAPPAPRPPSMNQQQPQTPFAQQFGPGAMNGTPSAGLALLLKRKGLLGGN